MSPSERIRPNSEAAPWVIKEVLKLESHLAIMKINWEHQRDRAAEVEAQLLAERARLDWWLNSQKDLLMDQAATGWVAPFRYCVREYRAGSEVANYGWHMSTRAAIDAAMKGSTQ